jgi:hypothetical protein
MKSSDLYGSRAGARAGGDGTCTSTDDIGGQGGGGGGGVAGIGGGGGGTGGGGGEATSLVASGGGGGVGGGGGGVSEGALERRERGEVGGGDWGGGEHEDTHMPSKAGNTHRHSDPHPPRLRAPYAKDVKPERPYSTEKLALCSAELAFWHCLTVGLQSWGVNFTSATRAGFIATATTMMVPFISVVLVGSTRPPPPRLHCICPRRRPPSPCPSPSLPRSLSHSLSLRISLAVRAQHGPGAITMAREHVIVPICFFPPLVASRLLQVTCRHPAHLYNVRACTLRAGHSSLQPCMGLLGRGHAGYRRHCLRQGEDRAKLVTLNPRSRTLNPKL